MLLPQKHTSCCRKANTFVNERIHCSFLGIAYTLCVPVWCVLVMPQSVVNRQWTLQFRVVSRRKTTLSCTVTASDKTRGQCRWPPCTSASCTGRIVHWKWTRMNDCPTPTGVNNFAMLYGSGRGVVNAVNSVRVLVVRRWFESDLWRS